MQGSREKNAKILVVNVGALALSVSLKVLTFFSSIEADSNTRTRSCETCRGTFYCSVACQNSHWQSHKPLCRYAKEIYDQNEVDAFSNSLQRDNSTQLVLDNYLEFSFAMAPFNAYDLYTVEGRNAKKYLTHVVVLDYTFDPRPAELRHRYVITSGNLVEKVGFIASCPSPIKMGIALSQEGLRVIDGFQRKIETEARVNGREVIRVPIVFQGRNEAALVGHSIILPENGWVRRGEDDYVDGLNQELKMPRRLSGGQSMDQLMIRLTARDNIRVRLANKEGRASELSIDFRSRCCIDLIPPLSASIPNFASDPEPMSLPSPTSNLLTLPQSLEELQFTIFPCNFLHCLNPSYSASHAFEPRHQKLWTKVLLKSLKLRAIELFRSATIQQPIKESLDIDAIVQSIVCGGISLDEMGTKKFGKALGTRIVLESWHSCPRSVQVDRIIELCLNDAAVYAVHHFGGCFHDLTDTHFLATVQEWIDQGGTHAFIDRDLEVKRKELIRMVDDLVQRRVVAGTEWEDREVWSQKIFRIHDSLYDGMEAGVRSIVNDDNFLPIHKHFFEHFYNPLGLIIISADNVKQFIERSGLSVMSDFILRGGLRGIEREMKKQEKLNKRKEVLKLRAGLNQSSRLLQLEDVEGSSSGALKVVEVEMSGSDLRRAKLGSFQVVFSIVAAFAYLSFVFVCGSSLLS
jgi:hypothetical protein